MRIITYVFIALFFAAGVLVYGSAKSAIHEILAALCFGFGALLCGAVAIIHQVKYSGDQIAGAIERNSHR